MLLNIWYIGVMHSVFAVLFYSGNSCSVVFLIEILNFHSTLLFKTIGAYILKTSLWDFRSECLMIITNGIFVLAPSVQT